MDIDILKQMIRALIGQETTMQRVRARTVGTDQRSKHWLDKGIKATKRYADGRQKAPHNRRNMRKRK